MNMGFRQLTPYMKLHEVKSEPQNRRMPNVEGMYSVYFYFDITLNL